MTFPAAGEKEKTIPSFPLDGEPDYQLLGQVLKMILLQAGLAQ